MHLVVDITSLAGKLLQVRAQDDWSAEDLKRAVAKAWDAPPSKQRLLTGAGKELQDGKMLCEYCQAGAERLQLSLVIMAKTKEEMDWEEQWERETPEWLQRAAEDVITPAEFVRMKQDVTWDAHHHSDATCRYHWRPTRYCNCVFAKEDLQPRLEAEAPIRRPLTCDEFLAAMQSNPCKLERCPSGQWSIGQDMVTREVVNHAIEREPALVLPHLEDLCWACDIVDRQPGVFKYLPMSVQQEQWVLHSALEADEDLRKEFLKTASKREVRDWTWSSGSRDLLGRRSRASGKAGKR